MREWSLLICCARTLATTWTDAGGELWLFGGQGLDADDTSPGDTLVDVGERLITADTISRIPPEAHPRCNHKFKRPRM
jgi:hypothetical protein